MNQSIWAGTYGHPWSADVNGNGVPVVIEPEIDARVAGQYLCARLAGLREIRAAHPDWASSRIPVLDALIVAHNAGESRLRTYPAIPQVTARFMMDVDEHVAAWSLPYEADAASELVALSADFGEGSTAVTTLVRQGDSAQASSGAGCLPGLGTSSSDVVVAPGTPNDVRTAVRTALCYVGVRSGWHGLCDRLACRAYGYVGSGYVSAKEHWTEMVASGQTHPGDTCPPLGSVVFWKTGRPFGLVCVVVQADPGCDPNKIMVTSNGVFDSATGNHGGVCLLSFAHLDAGTASGRWHVGWSDRVCKGAKLPAGTVHPAPSGR